MRTLSLRTFSNQKRFKPSDSVISWFVEKIWLTGRQQASSLKWLINKEVCQVEGFKCRFEIGFYALDLKVSALLIIKLSNQNKYDRFCGIDRTPIMAVYWALLKILFGLFWAHQKFSSALLRPETSSPNLLLHEARIEFDRWKSQIETGIIKWHAPTAHSHQ